MGDHVCPVWVGYLLASPLRKFFHDPMAILAPHIRDGMIVLDAGCAMGFFSLPMAKFVGPTGRLIAVDFQQKMLDTLRRRARRAGVLDRIEIRLCGPASLNLGDLAGSVDFALAFAVLHEVPNVEKFFEELCVAMKSGAKLLLAEPKGKVSSGAFQETVGIAEQRGFAAVQTLAINRSHAVILSKGAIL